MAEGGTDGSLKFDTKINTEGFEQGMSTLERAMDRLTGAVERLNANIASGFRDSGKAAAQTSQEVSGIGDEASRSEKKVEDLKEQMDAIQVSYDGADIPDNVLDAERRVPVRDPGAYGYDNDAMEYINGIRAAKEETNEFLLEISKLEQQMKDLEDQGMYFGDEEYDQAYLKLSKVKQALTDYKKELTSPTPDAVIFPADSLRGKIELLKIQLRDLEAAGRSFGDTLYDSIYRSLSEAERTLAQYRRELTSVQSESPLDGAEAGAQEYSGIVGTIEQALSGLPALFGLVGSEAATMFTPAGLGAFALTGAVDLVTTAIQKFVSLVAGAGKFALNTLKSLAVKAANALVELGKAYFFAGSRAEEGNNRLSTLGMLWKSIMFSFVFRAISGITDALKEGSDNLAMYSGSFNQVISSFVSSLEQLKNTVASAFAPITSVVIPVIDMLIQKIIQVINVIGQFISALGGKGTYIRAIKVNKDYAAGLEKTGAAAEQAGKDAKKALAPFDQLNEIQSQGSGGNGGSGGGAGAGGGPMFEEVGIDSGIGSFAQRIIDAFKAEDYAEVGRIIGEKINEAVKSISEYISWNRVGDEITRIVTMMTTIFNNMVDEIDWGQVGRMLGEGVNTVANTLYLLLKKTDWERLGKALGQALNGLVHKVDWKLFGNTIGAYFQAKIEGLHGFVTEADWSAIGLALQESISGIIEEIDWVMLGESFARGLSGLFASIKEFVTTFDWAETGEELASGISTFFREFDWATAGEAISGFVTGLLDMLIVFVEGTDWGAITAGITEFIEKVDWAGIAGRVLELLSASLGTALGSLHSILGNLISNKIDESKDSFRESVEKCGGNIVAGILTGIIGAMIDNNLWVAKHIFEPFMDGINNAFGIGGNSASSMEGVGKSLWEGFCNGIRLFFGVPAKFIQENITDPFVNAIRTLLGINGHSTVLEGVGSDTVAGFNDGVTKEQTKSQNVVQSWASGVAKWFGDKFKLNNNDSAESRKWASSIMSGFNTTVSQKYTDSQSGMEQWAGNARNWFVGSGASKGVNEDAWKKFASNTVTAFGDCITTESGKTQTPLTTWSSNTRTWFWGDSNQSGTGGLYSAFYNMAKHINEGFAKGISDYAHLSNTATSKWAQGVMSQAKQQYDINSPSREFGTIAGFVVKGFNLELLRLAGSSVSAAEKWLSGVLGVFDGIDIQVPVGLDIPNASAYIPRVASGSVVPPRAGTSQSRYGQEEKLWDGLAALRQDMRAAITSIGGSNDGDIHLHVYLEGKEIHEEVVKQNRRVKKQTGNNPLLT